MVQKTNQAHRSTPLLTLLLILSLSPSPTVAIYEWIPPGMVCDSVHNYKPEPFQGVPPPLPKLPDQYSMNIQANILQKAWSSDVTEHYDGPNNRATVFLTFNGTTTQTIFNYNTMETYDIFPDGSCKARGGQADLFGFFKMDRNHRPIKSTVYEMFHMGPKQNFTYVGNTWVRGIRVNHWTSCQEWTDFGAKFQLDYYFSHEDYQTAWGMGQIPIRAVVNGSAGNKDENQQAMFGRHHFEHIYDFTAFNVGPIEDERVFHLPHDVVCTGRRDFKALPDIPDNFQMDMEMNCPLMGSSMPFQHSLRYDWAHQMVETLMTIPSPQGNMAHMMGGGGGGKESGRGGGGLPPKMDKMVMTAMSTIDDHNTGLRYVTEKMNNTCRVSAMPREKDAYPMDHGKALFDFHGAQKTGNSPFSYQGRSTFRNIPVDVWGIETEGMIQKVFFLADDKEPTVVKDGAQGSNPMTSGDWSHWHSKGDQDDGKTVLGKPSGPKPNGGPGGIPNGEQSGGGPAGKPSGQNGGPTGRPNGQNGGPAGRPNGPAGSPDGQDGGPTGRPNGQNGGPAGRPNGQSGGPANRPAGQNGGPIGRPNGQNGGPTGRPSGAGGRPSGPMQNRGPTAAPGGQNGPMPNSWQSNTEDAKQKAKEKAKERAKEQAKEKAKETAKEEAKEKAKQKVKEKAKEKAKEARPTSGPGVLSNPGIQRAMEKMMNGRGSGNSQQGTDAGGAKTEFSSQDITDMIKKRREQQLKQNNPDSSGDVAVRRPMVSYPVIVGMVFRNRTAISTRNMPAFFQELMTPEILNWKEQMSQKNIDDESSHKSEGAAILDQHAMMQRMHSRMMRKAGEMDMNVFKFQPLHTDESMFQVSQCYDPEQTSHILLHVHTPFKEDVKGNKAAFSIAMRKGIAEAMRVSYIQISNLQPEPRVDKENNIDGTYVSFTLLGSPPVQPKRKQPSILEAKRRLLSAIDNGITFKVDYPSHTKSFMVDKSHYQVDMDMIHTPDDGHHESGGASSGGSEGYTAASVAGIAIATLLLGIVVAVAVIVLLQKRRHPEEPVIPYKITKT